MHNSLQWFVQAVIHHQVTRYETKVIRVPTFIIPHAKNEDEARKLATSIINPTNDQNIIVVFSFFTALLPEDGQ